MTHTYKVTGMTCNSCEAKVTSALLKVENVLNVEVSKSKNLAVITMDKHIALSDLQTALTSKYQISLPEQNSATKATDSSSWLATYKPILLIFIYLLGVALSVQLKKESFNWTQAMQHFMAGFFLVFSFFKMLDLKGFAESYAMYDIVAKKIYVWAYVYVFIELLLGIAYLVNFNPILTNLVTIVVMSISIIGVLQSVFDKKKIQCACLGAVFNLPMSTVTIVEDGLMIVMSVLMLLKWIL